MTQLTSPSESARAVANWFLSDQFNNPEKPLGSVSLLLAEEGDQLFETPKGDQSKIADANSHNVGEAITDWVTLCNKHPDNLAIFYFSGHGLASGAAMSLLLSDFGAKEFNPLEGAVDLQNLQNGVETCRAGNVMWIIDACRSRSPLVSERSSRGMVPIIPDRKRRKGLPEIQAHSYYSTLQGAQSYGKKGKASEFTEAFLKALGGYAADKSEGKWWVDTGRVAEIVQKFARSWYRGQSLLQKPESGRQSDFRICQAKTKSGIIDAFVTTRDRDSWQYVRLEHSHHIEGINAVHGTDLLAADKGMWEVQLTEKEIYSFKASWHAVAGKEDSEDQRYIQPPFVLVEL
ncbi:hypothetical protein GFL92_01030 [Rhizobium leguminosarum bv. viciae]|nr:hypothetical protein [Rhizobium leguminosarum bv. viciae]